MNTYFVHDSRRIDELQLGQLVDLIITSPPYYNMKDYGVAGQIGYGQDYQSYLSDLEIVFRKCFGLSKTTATLWIVVDVLKRDGELKLLPFDIIERAKQAGWFLRDIIIWKKDRTVPYAHRGEMRNIFEYILFFSKSSDYKFAADRITTVDDLKEWWIDYPERYSPNGKLPTNVWEYPIPIQGSWGRSYVRHFCPLPAPLIERIIRLTSDEGDVVLDPFAGSGAVLSVAYTLNRKFVGCDLNPDYRDMFTRYLEQLKVAPETDERKRQDLEEFSKLIWNLRFLKFPKTLYRSAIKESPDLRNTVIAVLVLPISNKGKVAAKYRPKCCKYVFVISQPIPGIEAVAQRLVGKPPLSKYGIDAEISFRSIDSVLEWIKETRGDMELWQYKDGKTQCPGEYIGALRKLELADPSGFPPIISPISFSAEDIARYS